MALPMLMGGADCGPVNPLQSLVKGFDQDKGVQQVGACFNVFFVLIQRFLTIIST